MFPIAYAENRAWKKSLVAKVSFACSEAICLVDEYNIGLGWLICHSWKLTTFVVVVVVIVVISIATLIILWVMT